MANIYLVSIKTYHLRSRHTRVRKLDNIASIKIELLYNIYFQVY